MASMKPSITNRASVEGNAHRSRQQSVKSAVCASSSQRCQRCGRRSDGFILQKETKSIRNSNSGCNSSVIQSMSPLTSAVKGNSRHRKYAKAPLIIDTGRVQFLRNCIKDIFLWLRGMRWKVEGGRWKVGGWEVGGIRFEVKGGEVVRWGGGEV